MSQIEVKILHQDYLLTCPEGQEAQLLEAAERVDSQFEKMRVSGKVRSRERLGVLIAVNLAYENLELRAQLKALQEKIATNDWSDNQSYTTEEEFIQLAALQSQQIRDTQIAHALIARIDATMSGESAAGAMSEGCRAAAENVVPDFTETPAVGLLYQADDSSLLADDSTLPTSIENKAQDNTDIAQPEQLNLANSL